MAFLRTIIRNGKRYQYFQQSVRVGKRVKSLHLGKVPPEKVGLRYIERLIEKYPGDPFAPKSAAATPSEKTEAPATAPETETKN